MVFITNVIKIMISITLKYKDMSNFVVNKSVFHNLFDINLE